MENIRVWHNNDNKCSRWRLIWNYFNSVTELKHSHGVSGESSASLMFWQHMIAGALEKFVRTVQMPNTVLLLNNPKVIFLLKLYPSASWTERDVNTNPVMRLRLPTQHVQCSSLWLFWPMSLFVAFVICQRDSKNYLFFHLLFVHEFLNFLKYRNSFPKCRGWCNR